jgi:hypothetical protein
MMRLLKEVSAAMTLSLYAPTTYPTVRRGGLYEPRERGTQKFDQGPSPLQMQAASLLTDKESRQAFQRSPETGNEGLPGLEVTPKDAVTSGMEVTKGMVDGMNADGDQVSSMLEANPNADLFQALKDHDRGAALDFAVHNQEFQVQAMHDMDDPAFQQEMRLRLVPIG